MPVNSILFQPQSRVICKALEANPHLLSRRSTSELNQDKSAELIFDGSLLGGAFVLSRSARAL